MEAESESGGKSRITASQGKAWLRKDILTVWIFHKLYPLATCPILIHLPIEIFQVLKIVTFAKYIILLNIISVPYICQFDLYF